MTLCIFLTLYIFFAHYHALGHKSLMGRPTSILAAIILACSQIILSELILGLTGLLYVNLLFTGNFVISTLLICYGIKKNGLAFSRISSCNIKMPNKSSSGVFDGYILALFALLVISYTIIMAAVYLFPPRGIDDLAYHLPAILEYTQSHSIKLLSVEIREAFAYPQNAELLFLWPLIFTNSQKMIDGVNVPFVFISILLIYSLLRAFVVPARDSLFIAILYALCPVVLMQAGSNYIDVILTLFFLLSLYFTILFLQKNLNCYAWYAGLSIGIACGMKYTALFLTIPLLLILLWKLFKSKLVHAIGLAAIVSLLGGWWYIRNAIVLGNPLYPMNVFASGMGFMGGSGESNALMDILVNAYDWLWLFPLADIGIGTFDGGFGLVFWGLGFPSWICLCFYTILNPGKDDAAKSLVLLQLPIGLLILLLVPKHSLVFNARYSMFIIPIGLLSFSLVLKLIEDNVYKNILKVICIVFSIASICLLSTSKKPSYRIDEVLLSPYRGIAPSEYLYPMDTEPVYQVLRHIWNPLDYLTKEDRPGINCYIASNKSYLALAPIYGSNIQNSPIMIGSEVPSQIEAFIYLHYPREDSSGKISKQEIFYPNTKITQEEVLSDPEYIVVTSTKLGTLVMSREYLLNPGKFDILRTYYGVFWPHAVEDATRLKPHLKLDIPLVTSDELAYGLLYEELDIGRMDTILTPSGYEEHIARSRHIAACYTLDKPLNGYMHKKLEAVNLHDKQVQIFFNERI